jgi:Tfp pilus assembly protein PilF
VAACLAALSCTRQPAQPRIERIAILRFENLGADASADWMGRAFSEVITAGLAGAPGVYAIPSNRLHSFDRTHGARPISAPGVFSERSLALVSGATRAGYGEYSVRGGRLEAHLTIEDPRTGKMTKVASASAAAGDVIAAASELTRQIAGRAAPYATRNPRALEAYVAALESADPAAAARDLTQAIAADPDFAPAYRQLAQWKAQFQDRAGAMAVLDQALARGGSIPEVERTRLEAEAADLRGDSAARARALVALARLDPGDPIAWRSLAESAMSRHEYRQSVEAFQKSLEAEPDDVTVLNQLGYAAAYAGDLNAAVAALGRYRTLRPADANPLDSQADVNLLAGRLREAESLYVQADKKDRNFLGGGDLFKAAMARLMTGDVAGADALAKQYVDARAEAKDPVVEYRKAQWSWVSGRRQAACQRMEAFARGASDGPLREVASRAYAELAMWNLVLGNRGAAAPLARQAASLAGPSSAGVAMVAGFLAEAPASSSEWAVRAEQTFPAASQHPIKNFALAYALLLGQEFQPASLLLKQMYEIPGPAADEALPFLLAWSYAETGRAKDAAPLLRFNPIPSPAGVGPFTPFYFPRIYYLRAVAEQQEGKRDQARANYRLFLQLSGPDPLLWGEERKAAQAQ